MYNICLIPGDGIGQEVIPAAKRVLEATGLPFNFSYAEAGWATFERHGTSTPQATLDAVEAADATLAGAFTSPNKQVPGHNGAIRHMRRTFQLFANNRPSVSRPIADARPGIDLLVVRENTEGLYVEKERRYGDTAIADAVITKGASERIAHIAMQAAQKRRKKVTIIHKANVLPLTSGLFLDTVLEVAKEYPDVQAEGMIVDAAAMNLVRTPEQFDVIVSTNLFGDILSDLTAGLTGGMGIAPSANIGEHQAIFEAVHGSAPDIAGRGIANPTATILSAAMMLDYLGEHEWAQKIDQAINVVLEHGPHTGDLGGNATTEAFTDAVIQALKQR